MEKSKAIKITQTNANTFLINDKEVFVDAENCWIAREEITLCEKKAFQKFLKKI